MNAEEFSRDKISSLDLEFYDVEIYKVGRCGRVEKRGKEYKTISGNESQDASFLANKHEQRFIQNEILTVYRWFIASSTRRLSSLK